MTPLKIFGAFSGVAFLFTFCGLHGSIAAAQKSKPVAPKKSPGQVVFAGNAMVFLPLLSGWVFDGESAQANNLVGAWVRKGETWQNGKVVLYVRSVPRPNGQAINKLVLDDIADFQKRNPQTDAVPDKSVADTKNRVVPMYVFSHVTDKTSKERVAYLETPTAFLVVVLSAYSDAAYQNSLPTHTALVRSLLKTAPITIDPKKESGKPST